MPEDRRLAAIMFTDIVGYTALMGKDEESAFQLLRKNRQVQKSIIEKHGGTWLKEIGDGNLASFSSASDAVRCAIAILEGCQKADIILRIGIHSGEVVFEDGDVFGDGVNVASRLQESAEKGCISISEAVYKDIKNKVGINTKFVEEKTFKNVDEPVKVYKVQSDEEAKEDQKRTRDEGLKKGRVKLVYILGGLIALIAAILIWYNLPNKQSPTSTQETLVTELKKSIAVLPFKNMSGDPGQEYLCDGLTDEIINHLFKIESFDKVVSLSSVLTYKGTNKRLPEIADELKVNYILEGTYKNAGDQIRISAQLIDARNDKHIWTNDYDQTVEEIFVIQADIAIQIARNLQAFLTSSETQNIQRIPTSNQEAYQLAQKAALAFEQAEWTKAEDYINQAIELDPNFADAYAGLGFLKLYVGARGNQTEIQSAVWEAKPYLEKALEIDPNVGLGHFGMALLNEWVQWDYIKAEKEYLKAMEIEPNNTGYIGSYVEFLLKMNQLEDALIYMNQLYEKDITTSNYRIWSYILDNMGRKKEAQEKINEGLELNGKPFIKVAGQTYLWLEEYDSALIYLDSAVNINDREISYPWFQSCLALANYKMDNFQKAQEIVDQIIDKSKRTSTGSPARFAAWYYSGIGEVDSAFYYLEIAYEKRSVEMSWLKVSPIFDDLRNDDRYWDLYERTGHKAYDEYLEEKKE